MILTATCIGIGFYAQKRAAVNDLNSKFEEESQDKNFPAVHSFIILLKNS